MESLEGVSRGDENLTVIAEDTNITIIMNAITLSHSWSFLYFSATLTSLLVIIGVLSNLLTIVAMSRAWTKLKNSTLIFIINLSVSDMIYCGFNLPLVVSTYVHGEWIHGLTACRIYSFTAYGNVGVSLMLIVMITVNRYLCIVHSPVYNKIYCPRYITAMVIFSWGFSYTVLAPTLFEVWGRFGFNQQGFCTIVKDDQGKTSVVVLQIFFFCVPLLVILFCYMRIFTVLRRSEGRLKKYSPNAESMDKSTQNVKGLSKSEKRLIQIALSIVLTFIICNLPMVITRLSGGDRRHPVLFTMSFFLANTFACINPFIYVIMSKVYRTAYVAVLPCGKQQTRQQVHDDAKSTEE